MKKENFVSLILGTAGTAFFALGMCMCLITEWNTFNHGIITGTIGIILLMIMIIIRRKMQGKPQIRLSKRMLLLTVYSIISVLIFGIGMCMTMVWKEMILTGIITGITGICMIISLIPLIKGLK